MNAQNDNQLSNAQAHAAAVLSKFADRVQSIELIDMTDLHARGVAVFPCAYRVTLHSNWRNYNYEYAHEYTISPDRVAWSLEQWCIGPLFVRDMSALTGVKFEQQYHLGEDEVSDVVMDMRTADGERYLLVSTLGDGGCTLHLESTVAA
jgi:hypothetical protein